MLDMLGEEGAQRYPQVARRIRYGRRAGAVVCPRRPDAALSGLYGERVARTRMVSVSVLFDGMLPKGLMSRPHHPAFLSFSPFSAGPQHQRFTPIHQQIDLRAHGQQHLGRHVAEG